MDKSLKGTWRQAVIAFFTPIIFLLILRWAVIEPFVIPSESMVPTLLVHDHLFVQKFSFGLKVPFFDRWLLRWSDPQPDDVIVFKYPKNANIYYIKRVIGVPGDHLIIKNSRVTRNNVSYKVVQKKYDIRYLSDENNMGEEIVVDVPKGKYFVMGDNRDQSSDSRVWGFVPEENLIGKAWIIWLSCDDTLKEAPLVCDPMKLRWQRIFKWIMRD